MDQLLYFTPIMICSNCYWGGSIIMSGIGVSEFFMMLRNGKQGCEWYFMKGYNITIKKSGPGFH